MDKPFTLSTYARLLWRRWPLIIAPILVALAVVVAFNLLTPRRYTSTVTLGAPSPVQAYRWEGRLYDLVDTRYDWRTEFLPLLTTRKLARLALTKVAGKLNQPIDAETLSESTKARTDEGTLFTVSVSAANPEDAVLLANAVAAALPDALADLYAGDIPIYQKALDSALTEQQVWDEKLAELRGATGLGFGFGSDLESRGDNELFGAHNDFLQEMVLNNSHRAALRTAIDRIDLVVKASESPTGTLSISLLNMPELKTYGLDYETLQRQAAENPSGLLVDLRNVRQRIAADLAQLDAHTIERQQKACWTL